MINIMVASKIEAAPVIDFFSLKKSLVYKNKTIYNGPLATLCIAGVGSQNMRQSVAILQSMQQNQVDADVWVNFGVAGSDGYDLGQLVIARLVRCDESDFFQHCLIPENMPFCLANVLTVAEPKMHYKNKMVYDMEAVGFVATVEEKTAIVSKLITDTPENPWHQQTKADIQQQIARSKDDIDRFFGLLVEQM